MKKGLSLLIAMIMVFSVIGVASSEGERPVIEMFYSPWGSTPHDGYDPYEEYAEALTGADFVLHPSADFGTEVLIRFASGDDPDFMTLGNSMLNTLYDQGVLIDDWMPYEEKMPTFFSRIDDTTRHYFDREGKLIVLPSKAEAEPHGWFIRRDWLDNLGLEMPTNMDELFEVLKAFTFNDPDGNGVDDTWGTISNGGGNSSGLRGWINFWCPSGFYIDEETKEVSHPVLNGAFLEYLHLAKRLLDEGVIHPDWFTLGGTEVKIPVFSQQVIGFVHWTSYHLIAESDNAHDNDGSIIGKWEVMPMFSGRETPMRGLYSQLRTVSAKCAEDPAKMDAITTLLEEATWPNQAYAPLMQGVGIDGLDVDKVLDNGMHVYGYSSPEQRAKHLRVEGSIMWAWCQFVHNEGNYIVSAEDELSPVNMYLLDTNAQLLEQPTWSSESLLLNFDPTVEADAETLLTQFELSYMMGDVTDDDWDAFVQTWLAGGGQELYDAAVETFTSYGFLK